MDEAVKWKSLTTTSPRDRFAGPILSNLSLGVAVMIALGCSAGEQVPPRVDEQGMPAAPTPTPRPPERLELREGVIAEVTEWGTGAVPGDTDAVRLHYLLRTAEGEELDNTRDRDGVHEVSPGDAETLTGLAVALKELPAGTKATLTLPPAAAFGALGYGDVIPPGTTLVLEIEVLEVVPRR